MIDFRIDYVQFSSNSTVRADLAEGHGWEFKSNNRFYKTMKRYDNGLVTYEGNPNTDKRLFVFAGKACENVNMSPDTLRRIAQFEPEYSRIDLAMTCDFEILSKIIADKAKVESRMYSDGKVIADLDYTPETIYFGDLSKRGRKGIVRCYDKALQLNLEGVVRNRIEIEYKQKHARVAAKRLQRDESIPSVMNSKFKINVPWYEEIFGEDVATSRFSDVTQDDIPEIERIMAWLHKQVVPSLKKVVEYDERNGTDNFKSIVDRLFD